MSAWRAALTMTTLALGCAPTQTTEPAVGGTSSTSEGSTSADPAPMGAGSSVGTAADGGSETGPAPEPTSTGIGEDTTTRGQEPTTTGEPDASTGTSTGDAIDPGPAGPCAATDAVLLTDFGDRRLYQYDDVVSKSTFEPGFVDTPEYADYVDFIEDNDPNYPEDLFDAVELHEAGQADYTDPVIVDLFEGMLDGSFGELTPTMCVQSAFVDLQNQDYPLWDAASEAAAIVLVRENGGRTELRAYVQTQDAMLSVMTIDYLLAAIADLDDGWQMRAHFHIHPFVFSGAFSGFLGYVVPSQPDLNTYQSLSADYGLEEAWISNGLHSLQMTADEFNAIEVNLATPSSAAFDL